MEDAARLPEAVSDLYADLGDEPWPNLLEAAASAYGLNPALLHRKFCETHGEPEAALKRKHALAVRENKLVSKARERRKVLSETCEFASFSGPPGKIVFRNNERCFLIGRLVDGQVLLLRENRRTVLTSLSERDLILGAMLEVENTHLPVRYKADPFPAFIVTSARGGARIHEVDCPTLLRSTWSDIDLHPADSWAAAAVTARRLCTGHGKVMRCRTCGSEDKH